MGQIGVFFGLRSSSLLFYKTMFPGGAQNWKFWVRNCVLFKFYITSQNKNFVWISKWSRCLSVFVLGYYKFRAADWSPNDDLFFFILNEQNAFDELFWNEHLIQTKWQKYAGPPLSWKAVAFFLIIAVWTARRQILMLVPDFCTEPSEGLGGIADLIMILNNQLSSRMICFTLKLWVLFFCSWESMIAQTAAV